MCTEPFIQYFFEETFIVSRGTIHVLRIKFMFQKNFYKLSLKLSNLTFWENISKQINIAPKVLFPILGKLFKVSDTSTGKFTYKIY